MAENVRGQENQGQDQGRGQDMGRSQQQGGEGSMGFGDKDQQSSQWSNTGSQGGREPYATGAEGQSGGMGGRLEEDDEDMDVSDDLEEDDMDLESDDDEDVDSDPNIGRRGSDSGSI